MAANEADTRARSSQIRVPTLSGKPATAGELAGWIWLYRHPQPHCRGCQRSGSASTSLPMAHVAQSPRDSMLDPFALARSAEHPHCLPPCPPPAVQVHPCEGQYGQARPAVHSQYPSQTRASPEVVVSIRPGVVDHKELHDPPDNQVHREQPAHSGCGKPQQLPSPSRRTLPACQGSTPLAGPPGSQPWRTHGCKARPAWTALTDARARPASSHAGTARQGQPGRRPAEDRQIPLRAALLQPGSRPKGSGHVVMPQRLNPAPNRPLPFGLRTHRR